MEHYMLTFLVGILAGMVIMTLITFVLPKNSSLENQKKRDEENIRQSSEPRAHYIGKDAK